MAAREAKRDWDRLVAATVLGAKVDKCSPTALVALVNRMCGKPGGAWDGTWPARVAWDWDLTLDVATHCVESFNWQYGIGGGAYAFAVTVSARLPEWAYEVFKRVPNSWDQDWPNEFWVRWAAGHWPMVVEFTTPNPGHLMARLGGAAPKEFWFKLVRHTQGEANNVMRQVVAARGWVAEFEEAELRALELTRRAEARLAGK